MSLLPAEPPPRRCAVPLLVEGCAGTAALSLRLERAGARPPVSRMGAKTGYADVLLALVGLEPGDRAEHYLWCEPDPGCRLLLEAYRDADLAAAAADIIRSWADEDPRDLWHRLRDEGPARHDCTPREVARYLTWTAGTTGGLAGAGGFKGLHRHRPSVDGFIPSREGLANAVDPREVARQAFTAGGAFRQGDVASGYAGDPGLNGGRMGDVRDRASTRLGGLPTIQATLHDDARTLPCPSVPEGSVVYIDPPYKDTTGYADELPRSEVEVLARRWSAAGARVMVSEAEALPGLVADGWWQVDITAMRQGQARTFSKQQREVVTCSFEPPARVVRACELALDRAERRAQALTGGDQQGLFGPGGA